MGDRVFGVSTRLFRDSTLTRDHLVHIAAHGFEAIELYAAPGHFDSGSGDAVSQLSEWLGDTRLHLTSVHSIDATPEQIAPLVQMAHELPYRVLVIHRPTTNTEKTVHGVIERAAGSGLKVAIEARGGRDASIEALVALLEDEESEAPAAGICFDFGHVNRSGDVSEALEIASGHILTTHVHDNRGRQDDRLVPYAGRIPWDEAMMEIQKVGYDGPLIFEYDPVSDPVDLLARSVKARERLEKAFIVF